MKLILLFFVPPDKLKPINLAIASNIVDFPDPFSPTKKVIFDLKFNSNPPAIEETVKGYLLGKLLTIVLAFIKNGILVIYKEIFLFF